MAWGPRTILPSPWAALACQVLHAALPSNTQYVLLPGLTGCNIYRSNSLLSLCFERRYLKAFESRNSLRPWLSQSVQFSGIGTLGRLWTVFRCMIRSSVFSSEVETKHTGSGIGPAGASSVRKQDSKRKRECRTKFLVAWQHSRCDAHENITRAGQCQS